MLSFFICPYTHWRRMILPTDPRLSTVWYVRCTYWMFVWMISTVLSIINVLSFFTCPYTQWKRMILPSVQRLLRTWYFRYIYILDVCMNDLHCLVNHTYIILPHMSLYTLKTNDLTYWSTLINCMVYQIHILDVSMNDLNCFVNHQCVILLHMSL